MLHRSSHRVAAPQERHFWWYSRLALTPEMLVSAGVLMFALYIFMDLVASVAYDGYSYRDQTISELSAIGAPTRTFWLVMSVAYQVLGFAFAFGVLAMAGHQRALRIVGWLLLASAVGGLLLKARCYGRPCSPSLSLGAPGTRLILRSERSRQPLNDTVPEGAFELERIARDRRCFVEEHRCAGSEVEARPAGFAHLDERDEGAVHGVGQLLGRRGAGGSGIDALRIEVVEAKRQVEAVVGAKAAVRVRWPAKFVVVRGAAGVGASLGEAKSGDAEHAVGDGLAEEFPRRGLRQVVAVTAGTLEREALGGDAGESGLVFDTLLGAEHGVELLARGAHEDVDVPSLPGPDFRELERADGVTVGIGAEGQSRAGGGERDLRIDKPGGGESGELRRCRGNAKQFGDRCARRRRDCRAESCSRPR